MDFDLSKWREAIADGRILWRAHAVGRMLNRNISRADVTGVLLSYDIIEEYPNDEPHPSVLLIGCSGQRVVHVVAAFDGIKIYVITAYEPGLDHFEDCFRRRRA